MIAQPSRLARRLLIALLAGGIAITCLDPSFAQPRRVAASTQSDAAAKEQASDAKRLPADVTTDQAVELTARTLRFKATAGTIPINTGEGKLQAEIAFIAYQLPDTPGASPHLRVQRRPRRLVGLSAARRARAVAPAARRRRAVVVTRDRSQSGDLARLHRPGVRRSGRHRLQPLHQHRRRGAQAVLVGRRRHRRACDLHAQMDREERPPGVEEIHRGRELWRLPRAQARRQAQRTGRRASRAS